MTGRYGPSEAWIRDAIWSDPWPLVGHVLDADEYRSLTMPGFGRKPLIEREFGVPSGRIDLLIVLPLRIVIVEFKREVADAATVAQVLRYKGHFESEYPKRVTAVVAAPGFAGSALGAAHAAGVVLLKVVPSIGIYPVADRGPGLGSAAAAKINDAFQTPIPSQSPSQDDEIPF